MSSSHATAREDLLADRLRERLLAWYDSHARDLPWRKDRGPYRVWISEIMLQQTRVAAVIEHYHEFLKRFPTVQKLAAAREASVLSAWSGLGYYRRARMLHAAAKVVVRDHEGKFPKTAEDWRVLPGIGRYTAAAISSIATGEPIAVVDGNVERVLQRLSGKRLTGEQFWKTAQNLLDRERAGDFNQAMMELGATVCTPRSPACLMCPVTELCATRGELVSADRTKKQMKCEADYALHRRDGRVYLVQRPKDARLMAGMWELPVLQPALVKTGEEQIPGFARNDRPRGGTKYAPHSASHDKKHGRAVSPIFTVRHSITVTDYTVRVWDCPPPDTILGKWVSCHSLSKMPLTGLARKVLRKAQVLP